jgi:hypothetical protein
MPPASVMPRAMSPRSTKRGARASPLWVHRGGRGCTSNRAGSAPARVKARPASAQLPASFVSRGLVRLRLAWCAAARRSHRRSCGTHVALNAARPTPFRAHTLMLGNSATRLVLVGDPCQLGPHVRSHEAARLGLGVPLMERLGASAALQRRSLVVQLVNNYRAHWRSGRCRCCGPSSLGRVCRTANQRWGASGLRIRIPTRGSAEVHARACSH